MKIHLVNIPGIPTTDLFAIKALKVNDREAAVVTDLSECFEKDPNDYDKIMDNLEFVGQHKRPIAIRSRVKKSAIYDGVYEAKGGKMRVFFFYADEPNGPVVVCTNTYWKTNSSRKKQNRAFECCARLREEYLKAALH
jgi:hypothetical protein